MSEIPHWARRLREDPEFVEFVDRNADEVLGATHYCLRCGAPHAPAGKCLRDNPIRREE